MTPRRTFLACVAMLAVALMGPGSAVTQTDTPGLEDKETELSTLRQRIQAHRDRAAALEADEKSQLERLSELEKQAALTEELLAGLSERAEVILEQTATLETGIRESEARVAVRREQLGIRLRAMYKRGERSALLYLVTASSVENMTARMRSITHVARAEKKLINDVLADQRTLQMQRGELRRRLSEVHRTQSEAEDQRVELERLQGDRVAALGVVRQEREQFEASLQEMEHSAQALEDLIAGLAARRQPSSSGTPSAFVAAKGLLPWPLEGDILKPYGRAQHPEFKTVVMNKGINIAASIGEPIRAVATGEVEYVNWLPGYGKCIIVNHGDGYFTLYAHASKIFPAQGQAVSAGEVLGEAGDTGSLNGSQLYFEVRKGRDPVNPLEWLSRR